MSSTPASQPKTPTAMVLLFRQVLAASNKQQAPTASSSSSASSYPTTVQNESYQLLNNDQIIKAARHYLTTPQQKQKCTIIIDMQAFIRFADTPGCSKLLRHDWYMMAKQSKSFTNALLHDMYAQIMVWGELRRRTWVSRDVKVDAQVEESSEAYMKQVQSIKTIDKLMRCGHRAFEVLRKLHQKDTTTTPPKEKQTKTAFDVDERVECQVVLAEKPKESSQAVPHTTVQEAPREYAHSCLRSAWATKIFGPRVRRIHKQGDIQRIHTTGRTRIVIDVETGVESQVVLLESQSQRPTAVTEAPRLVEGEGERKDQEDFDMDMASIYFSAGDVDNPVVIPDDEP